MCFWCEEGRGAIHSRISYIILSEDQCKVKMEGLFFQNFKEFQGSDSEILHSVWAKNKYCMTSCMGGSQSSQIQRDRK